MNKKIIVTAFLLAAGLFATRNAQAQRTYEEMERLTVNEQVTTVITATEPVRFVDISTDKNDVIPNKTKTKIDPSQKENKKTDEGHVCVCKEGPVFNIKKLLWQI